MRQMVAVLMFASLGAACPAPASAQSCSRASLDESLAASDTIVSGVVGSARLVGVNLDVVQVEILATRVFKGEPAERYVVYTRRPGCTPPSSDPRGNPGRGGLDSPSVPSPEADCNPSAGFEFVAGEHYVVFAFANGRTDPPEIESMPGTTLVTNACTYTAKQFPGESSAVVRWLERAGRDAR
jgi:hypothetical protein